MTRGYFATVSASAYNLVVHIRWYPLKAYHPDGSLKNIYAYGRLPDDKHKTVYLHRLLMGVTNPKIDVDHKDHVGLNCTYDNMIVVPRTKNLQNSRLRSNSTSGYKGVTWDKERQKWIVFIRFEGHQKYLGRFAPDNIIGAARAYDAGSIRYHGKHGCTNVMLGLLPPLD
jgi:hypothetical protein